MKKIRDNGEVLTVVIGVDEAMRLSDILTVVLQQYDLLDETILGSSHEEVMDIFNDLRKVIHSASVDEKETL